jgi:hypothetical protein
MTAPLTISLTVFVLGRIELVDTGQNVGRNRRILGYVYPVNSATRLRTVRSW